jgi:hypothetical protein
MRERGVLRYFDFRVSGVGESDGEWERECEIVFPTHYV